MVYISTQNLMSAMSQPILQTQSNLAIASKEVSSGVYADLGLQLGGQSAYAISLAQQSQQLTAITAANATVSTRLSATNSALNSIMTNAQNLSDSLLSDSSTADVLLTSQTQAQTSLQSMIGQLNTSVAGEYIFAGINTNTPAMNDYATVQGAADTAISSDLSTIASDPSQITGTQMQDYLSNTTSAFPSLYQAPGWSALSSASTTPITSQISQTQKQTTSVSAAQSAFQNITQAYSLISGMANQKLGAAATQQVVATATALLNSGITSLTNIEAGVGIAQDNVAAANTQMAAQQNILTQNVDSLENVDPTTLSTTISALQTQLQDSYSVTNQLKSLSLVNYISAG